MGDGAKRDQETGGAYCRKYLCLEVRLRCLLWNRRLIH
jgi:hypothetical protein